MNRHIRTALTIIATLIGAAGCAAHGADADETRVSADGQDVIVGAFTDELDPAWWAIEVRTADAEIPDFVLSSDDVPQGDDPDGSADLVAALREKYGDALEASNAWYGCGIATCPEDSFYACMDQHRHQGCR